MSKGMAVLLITLLALAPVAAQEQQPAPQPEKPQRLVVTFDGHLEALPDLSPGDFQIEAGKQKLTPTRLLKPTDLPTVLAIVLQENQTPEFGTQLDALRDFILAQPPNTYVGVFYLSVQSVETAIMFDSNLPKVAEALRMPKGLRDLAPPSPYATLAKLASFMAGLPDARKEILWFSEGSDATVGGTAAGQNHNLQVAVRIAQEAGIPIWPIFSSALAPASRLHVPPDEGQMRSAGPGYEERPMVGSSMPPLESPLALAPSPLQYNIAYLDYVADHTGGKLFSAGGLTPDIRPHLDEYRRLLAQQVVLEYSSPEALKKVKLLRKLKGAKMLAPSR